MKFIIISLFPESFESYFQVSLIQRAIAKKFIQIDFVNLRDFGEGPHKVVDLPPYGAWILWLRL